MDRRGIRIGHWQTGSLVLFLLVAVPVGALITQLTANATALDAIDDEAAPQSQGTTPPAPSTSDSTKPKPGWLKFLEALGEQGQKPGSQGPPVDPAAEAPLRMAIQSASRLEAQAVRTLDVSALPGSFTGEALKAVRLEVQEARELRTQGVVMQNFIESQEFHSVAFVPGAQKAEARVTEVWSTNYLRADTGQCVEKIASHAVPQTIYLAMGQNGWMVTSISFDSQQPPAQRVRCQ